MSTSTIILGSIFISDVSQALYKEPHITILNDVELYQTP